MFMGLMGKQKVDYQNPTKSRARSTNIAILTTFLAGQTLKSAIL